MGSRLVLDSLPVVTARDMCREHLSFLPEFMHVPCDDREWYQMGVPACLYFPPCGTNADPRTIWGGADMLHWVFDPGAWEEALSHGNGYDRSSDETGRITTQGL